MAVINITAANFEAQVLQNPGKVLLDFWAPWCGPCRMVAPILEDIAQDDETLTIGKINVDEEIALASRFGIVSIPTLILFEAGAEKGKAVGYRPKEDLLKFLNG